MLKDPVKSLNDLVTEYTSKVDVMKKELKKAFEGDLETIFTHIFETYPQIKALSWTQFTPYHNDGEPCVFGVGDLQVFDDPDDSLEDLEYGLYLYEYKDKYPEVAKISKLLDRSSEILLMIFDDHVIVKVTREGIKVDEFEHE